MEASTSDCSHDCVLDKGKQMANPIVMQSVCLVDQEATCPHGRPIRIPLESQVLSLLGNVHNLPINILIDSGCTNNFVRYDFGTAVEASYHSKSSKLDDRISRRLDATM